MTKRFKTAVLYQLWESRTALWVYYLIRIGIMAVFFPALMMLLAPSGGTFKAEFGGMEVSSIIFIFVVGLNSFSETFRTFLQNGISRGRLVASYVTSLAIISFGMALIDSIVCRIPLMWAEGASLFSEIYSIPDSSMRGFGIALLWSTVVYFRAAMLGYLITALYYRMNKTATVAVSAGVPVFAVIVLPIIEDMFTKGVIFSSIGRYMMFEWLGVSDIRNITQVHPWNAILFSVLYSAVSLGLAWILIRRAEIKSK